MRREDLDRLVREEHAASSDEDTAAAAREALAAEEAEDGLLRDARERRGH